VNIAFSIADRVRSALAERVGTVGKAYADGSVDVYWDELSEDAPAWTRMPSSMLQLHISDPTLTHDLPAYMVCPATQDDWGNLRHVVGADAEDFGFGPGFPAFLEFLTEGVARLALAQVRKAYPGSQLFRTFLLCPLGRPEAFIERIKAQEKAFLKQLQETA